MSGDQATGNSFRCELSEDKLAVTVSCAANAKMTASAVINTLKEMGIRTFDDGLLIEAIQKRTTEAFSMVVVQGVAAVDERPPKVNFLVPIGDRVIDVINRVESGKLIAIINPATGGTDGRDVFGNPVPYRKAAMPFEIGKNIKSIKGQLITTARGRLSMANKQLSVEPLLEISSDDLKPIKFEGDVAVRGSVRDGQRIHASGALFVGGAIEAAELCIEGSLYAKGGIIGKSSGRCVVSGDLHCRFISSSRVSAFGSIHVQSELVQSTIICGGKLLVSNGSIIGGDICSNGGISCNSIGNANGIPTLVEAGSERARRAFTAALTSEIELNTSRARQIRAKIGPLVAHLKSLTAAQREKVTELLADASELEAYVESLVEKAAIQTGKLKENTRAEIEVSQVAHAGVVVRLGNVETVINTALKGPFKLTTRKLGSMTEILLVDDESSTPLPSRPLSVSETSRGKATVLST